MLLNIITFGITIAIEIKHKKISIKEVFMKARYYLFIILMVVHTCFGNLWACTVGYFTDGRTYDTTPATVITQTGYTPVHISDISTFDLNTVDVLMINVFSTNTPSQALLDRQAVIEIWVRAGGKMIIHDRSAGNAGGLLLIGSQESTINRNSNTFVELAPFGTGNNKLINGSYGTITTGMLKNSNGFVLSSTLPPQAVSYLVSNENTNNIASFMYPIGLGYIYYSGIPLDYYLLLTDNTQPGLNYRTLYLPNLLTMICDIAIQTEPEPQIGDNCQTAQNLGELTSPYEATTTGYLPDFYNKCGNYAPDRIFYIDVPDGYQVDIRQISNTYDSQHSLRYGGNCPGDKEVACVNDTDTRPEFFINLTGVTQRVFWINGAYYRDGHGDFVLEWSISKPDIKTTWTGEVSTDWDNPENWDLNIIPNDIVEVTISGGAARYPDIDGSLSINSKDGTYQCRRLNIQAGSQLTTRGTVIVKGSILMHGGTWYHLDNHDDSIKIYEEGLLDLTTGLLSCGDAFSNYQTDLIVYDGGQVTVYGGTLAIADELELSYGSRLILNSGLIQVGTYTGSHPGSQDAKFDVNEQATFSMEDGSIEIQRSYGIDQPGLRFHSQANITISGGEIIFSNASADDTTLYADLNGHVVPKIIVRLSDTSHHLLFSDETSTIGQLFIDSGTVRINGKNLYFSGISPAITIGDGISNEDAIFELDSGTVHTNASTSFYQSLYIQSDGRFDMQSGEFERQVFLAENFVKVIQILNGGVFNQQGGTFTIDNKHAQNAWGITIESNGLFQLSGGLFQNDAQVHCYGTMNFQGGTFHLVSQTDETSASFDVFSDGNIQAKNTVFDQFSQSSGLPGILVYSGANIGTSAGDDDMDFDGCTFQNWHPQGVALTIDNTESFSINAPVFENNNGKSISKTSSGLITVTGSKGSRFGEYFDNEPEGTTQNLVTWDNTVCLSGKDSTGHAIKPSDNELNYYASNALVAASGEGINGPSLRWQITPSGASIPESGASSPAVFTLTKNGQITWYSGIPGKWVGSESSQWSDPDNWDDHKVPTQITDVVLPESCPNYPELSESLSVNSSEGTYRCRTLKLEPGAMLTTHATVISYSIISLDQATWLHTANQINSFQIKSGGQLIISHSQLTLGQSSSPLSGLIVNSSGELLADNSQIKIYNGFHVQSLGKITVQSSEINIGMGKQMNDIGLKFSDNALVYFQDSTIIINGCAGSLYPSIQLGVLSQLQLSKTPIIFQPLSASLETMYASFGGKHVGQVVVKMIIPQQVVKLVSTIAEMDQLIIERGSFDPNGQTLRIVGNQTAIIVGDESVEDDAELQLTSGNIQIKETTEDICALRILKDGKVSISGGSFSRNILLNDSYDKVIWIEAGGIFNQSGGTVTLNNQYGDYHWGIMIDFGANFQLSGGVFENDSSISCYGLMDLDGGLFKLSSGESETETRFDVYENGAIHARNTTFSQYANASASLGINIHQGARIGTLVGDDDDDFDHCTFQNWYINGSALTFSNAESFTITEPTFNNSSGLNIMQQSSAIIHVTGSNTGTRGGERYDSDSEGSQINTINWEDTCTLIGKNATGTAVSPSENETLYYASGFNISATGELLSGSVIHWIIIPEEAASPSNGDGQNASFTIHQSAEIVWYSGTPGQWTGAVSNQWTDPANWSDHQVPDYTIDVFLSGKLNRYPVLDDALYVNRNNGVIQCKSINLEPLALITCRSEVFAYSGIQIKGGTWLQESDTDNAIQIKPGGHFKLLGGTLSVGRIDQDSQTDLLINDGGSFTLEAGDAFIVDAFHVEDGGTLQVNGGQISVGQFSGAVSRTPHAVFQMDANGRLFMNGGTINIQSPCCNDTTGLVFDPSATIACTGGEFIFRSVRADQQQIEADFGGHAVHMIRIDMYASDHRVILGNNDSQFKQLFINKGQFDLNHKTLAFDGPGPSITIGNQEGTDDASFLLSENGTVNINQSIKAVKALLIQSDGAFLMSGGAFNRNVFIEDNFDAVIHVASGGLFQQNGGQVIIDNQTPEYHWGIWIDDEGEFRVQNGYFYNDAKTRCYGNIMLMDSSYYVSSSCNETSVNFLIENDARIQAKNSLFSRYCNNTVSKGIYIKTTATIGETSGDDDDDFDGCRFENWSSIGSAMTVENTESFTMVQAVFNNSHGVNIDKESSGQIIVTGLSSGTRGGELYDSDPEGGMANYVHWENTSGLTGKSFSAKAVSPAHEKTFYYSTGSQVSALGTGIPLSWEITPVNSVSVSAGINSPANFVLNGDATITWYSIKPGLWRGFKSSDWTDPANWDDGNVPDETLSVTIPYTCTYFPILNHSVVCDNLTLDNRAQLTVQSMTLTVKGHLFIETDSQLNNGNGVIEIYGDFNNTGTFTAQTGTVVLGGYSNCQVINGNSEILTFNRLIIHKQNQSVITLGNVRIENELMIKRGAPHFTGGLEYASNAVLTYGCQMDRTMGTEIKTMPRNIHINTQASIFLPNSIEILGSLALSNGFLVMGDYDLRIDKDAYLSGNYSNTAMIVSNGDGLLIREIVQPGVLDFPVGAKTDEPSYSPLTLMFHSGEFNNGAVSVQVIDEKFLENPSLSNYADCYWDVAASGISNYSCNVSASLQDSDIKGSKQSLYFGLWNGSNWFLLDQAQDTHPVFSGVVENLGIFTGGEQDFYQSRIIISGYLDHFCGVKSGGISEEKSYIVSGSNLLSDIEITIPDDFEISTTSGYGYVAYPQKLILERQQTNVPETQLYVVFKPSIGTIERTSDYITHRSYGADTKKITASGSGLFIRTIVLSAPTPADGIQVKVVLNKEVFDYSHVLSGGADIRFMKGDQVFPYWIQTWNPEGQSIIWIRISDAGTSSFDMEYGTEDIETMSDGLETFELFDDFSSSSLNSEIWRTENATVSVSEGHLYASSSGNNGGISSIKSFEPSDTFTYEAVYQASIRTGNRFILLGFSGSTNPWQPRTGIYAFKSLGRFGSQNGAIDIYHETNDNIAIYDEGISHIFSVILNSGYDFDDNLYEFAGTSVSSAYATISTYMNGSAAIVDWMFVRKSPLTALTSSLGAECNLPGGGVWLGRKSSDWSDPENWNSGGVPKNSDNVIIDANAPNMPRLTTISNCKQIEINKNASLYLGNYQLNVYGAWKNSGALFPQTGAICFRGDTDIDASGLGPNTQIVGNQEYTKKYTFSGSFYLGYRFKITEDISIFSFRSYFGTKISLWNASGNLITTISTGAQSESWVEYSLSEPVQLTANESYILAAYSGGKPYYISSNISNEFADGVLMEPRLSNGDSFPEQFSSTKWWMVDLIYRKGSGSGSETFHRLIIQKDGNHELIVRKAHIENMLTIKSGRFTVSEALTYAPEASLEYATIDNYTTTVNELPQTDGPQSIIVNSTGIITLNSDYRIDGRLTMIKGIFQLGSNTLSLGPDASIVVSTTHNPLVVSDNSGALRQLLSSPRTCLFPVGTLNLSPQYSPLIVDIESALLAENAYIDVRVVNDHYEDSIPSGSLHSLNRYWQIQQNNVTQLQCKLSASYLDSDILENVNEKNLVGAFWDGIDWTNLNRTDLGINTFDGMAFDPLIVSAFEFPLPNALPKGENKSFILTENESYGFTPTDFGFADDDPYDVFNAIRISQLPGAGQLLFQTAPVQNQQIIGVENISQLIYTPALNESGDNYAFIKFQVQDSDLGWSESSYTLTVNVLTENKPPQISQNGPISITISEDLSPIAWNFPSISAIDPDGDIMVWQIAVPPEYGTATIQGTGAYPSSIHYTPNQDYFGQDQWVISVWDTSKEPLADTIVVWVTIEPVNDPPLFECNPQNSIVLEDFVSSIIISVTPVTPPENESSQIINYYLESESNNIVNAAVHPNSGTVTISSLPDKNGVVQLDIVATDHQSQHALARQSISVTVVAVNDPPLFYLDQNEINVSEDFSQTISVNVVPEVIPSDEISQSVHYYLSPAEIDFVDLSINSETGKVTLSSVMNGNGSREIKIVADDGQSSNHFFEQPLSINVLAVNDPPTFHLSRTYLRFLQDFPDIESIETVLNPFPADEATQTIAFTLSPASVSFANVSIDPGTGNINISRVSQGVGIQTFVVTAVDGQTNHYTSTASFTLEIIPEMPPLDIRLNRNVITVNEDFTHVETIETILETDDYYTERSVAYSLSPSTIDFAQLSINSETGEISITSLSNGNGTISILVIATDMVDAELSSTDTFTLSVLPVNDPPNFQLSETQVTCLENETTPLIISIIPDSQPKDEAAQAASYFISPSTSELLTVSVQSLQKNISILPKPDRNGFQDFTIIALEQSPENNKVIRQLSVTVIGVNTPPVFELSNENIYMLEDDSVPLSLTVIPMTQPEDEVGQNVTYALSPSTLDFITISIDSSTGEVVCETIPNQYGQARVALIAHEDHVVQNADYTNFFDVIVESVNDSPTFHVNKKVVQVPEDFSTTEIITITPDPTPENEKDQPVTYSLLPETVDFASININEINGAISIQSIKNQNGSEQLTIIADDHAPSHNIATSSIDLIVYPVNDPPDFTLSQSGMTLIEDFTQTKFIQIIPMERPLDEIGQVVSYSMMPPEIDFANVSIEPVTGEIQISQIADKHGFQRFTIKANDLQDQNNIASQFFDLTITSVNDPPLFGLSQTSIAIKEGFNEPIIINAIPGMVPDDEKNQLVTYYLTPQIVDFIQISIDPASGQITIINEQQKNGSQVFVVTATDHQFQNYTAKVEFSVSVRPSNDPPIFQLSESSVLLSEDFEQAVTLSVIPAPTPPDEIDQVITYSIMPEQIDFANIYFDSESGVLTVTHIKDANGSQLFTITADDHQAISNLYQQEFTLEIKAINDPPEMTLNKYELILDEDFSSSETIYCLPKSVPQDETIQTVAYRLSPSTCEFADIQIIPYSGRVTIKSLANKNGRGNFYIIADDGQQENRLYQQSFFLNVNPINDPPQFTISGNEFLLKEDFEEDIHIQVTPGVVPMDEQDQIIRYSLDPQSTPFATVNVNAITGEITIRSRPDENGVQTFKLIANDYQSQHQYYEQTFMINVQAENDPPQFTLSRYSIIADEDFENIETILVVPGFSPSDETGQYIQYQLIPTSVNFASVSINKDTGMVQVKSTLNGNGNQLFSIIADDGQEANNTTTVQFSVIVEAINDPPQFTLSSHELTFAEDFDLIQTVFSQLDTIPSDERNQVIRFSIETTDVSVANIKIDPISGKLTIRSLENLNGSQMITVVADDGQRYNSRYEDTLTINIQSINDSPVFSLDRHEIIVEEDFNDTQWISVIPGEIPFDEKDQIVTYQINPEDSSIVSAIIDPVTGKVQLNSKTDQNGSQLFTIIANDGQSNNYLSTSSFAITIVAVNDPPQFILNPPHLVLEEGFSDINRIDIELLTPPWDERSQRILYRLEPETIHLANIWLIPEESALYIEKKDNDQYGFAQVSIIADDGQTQNATASQLLSLTLTSVNDSPVAYNSSFSVFEDQRLQGQLIAKDSDNDNLVYQITRLPINGTAFIHSDSGTFEYTPNINLSGEDSFLFKVTDGKLISNSAIVSIHITPVNDVPRFSAINDLFLMEGILPEPIAISLVDNDGGNVSVSLISSNTNLISEDGIQIIESSTLPYVPTVTAGEPHIFHLKLRPRSGIAGKTTIQLKAMDQSGGEHIQQFDITVEKYIITAWHGENGSCVPSGEIPVNTNSSTTFGFYPDNGYEVDELIIDGNAVDSTIYSSGYTFKNISDHHSLSVTFERSIAIFVNFITSDPREGYAPVSISFISQIQGNVSRLLWDFGDGTTGTSTNPVHVYTKAGYHTVRLTAYGSEGSKYIEKTNYILVKSRKIQGKVVAQDSGLGLSGYTVEVWQTDGDLLQTTLTDNNGQYVVEGLPKANDLILSAWPPYGKTSYFPQYYRNQDLLSDANILSTIENDLSNIDFFLDRAPNIGFQGCVLAESGNLNSGIPGIQVDLFSNKTMFGTAVYTNESGCYSVTHLKPSDDYRVSVWYGASGLDYYYAVADPLHVGLYHPAYSVSRWFRSTEITPSDPHIQKIDIILDPIANRRGTIKGTIYKSTGTPLPGVWVSAISDELNDQNSALSDANGHYTITELTPVTYEESLEKGYIVEINTDNYPYQAYNQSNTRETATRVSTGRDDIHFYLTITRTISGTVTTQCNFPISELKVAAWPKTGGQYQETLSDISGNYVIDKLQPSSEYIVAIFPINQAVIYYPDKKKLIDAELLDLSSQNLKDINFSILPTARLDHIIGIFQALSGMLDDNDCYPYDMDENGRVELIDALIMLNLIF